MKTSNNAFYIPSDEGGFFDFNKRKIRRYKKAARKLISSTIVGLVCLAMILWTIGVPFSLFMPKSASAISAATVTNLVTASTNKIKALSAAKAVLKFVVASGGGETLNAVTVAFNGTGWATTSLADLAVATSSGVAIYRDSDSGGTAGTFDATDLMLIATSTPSIPVWIAAGSASSTTVVFNTPYAMSNGTYNFYVVIKTSATVSNGATIIATIPENAIVTAPAPSTTNSLTSASPLTVDTVAPVLTALRLANYRAVDMVFSEPLDTTLAASTTINTLVTASTTDSETVSRITSMPGNNVYRLKADGAEIRYNDTLTISNNNLLTDLAGNATSSATFTLRGNAVVINEVMWGEAIGPPTDHWIELRNMTNTAINMAGWKISTSTPTANDLVFNSTYFTDPAVSFTIATSSYYLILNYATTTASTKVATTTSATVATTSLPIILPASGAQITLKNAAGEIIDQTPSGAWTFGLASPSPPTTMVRSLGPGNGTTTTSWMTAQPSQTGTSYNWKAGQTSVGTPGRSNDTSVPGIDFMAFGQAKQDVNTDIIFRAFDDSLMMGINTVTANVVYSSSTVMADAQTRTSASGIYLGAGFFKVTIPSVSASSTLPFKYYLKATDAAGNIGYQPGPTLAIATSTAFSLSFVAATDWTASVSGTVRDSAGNPIVGATVFDEGNSLSATTDAAGAYTLNNLPVSPHNLRAFKEGYMDMSQSGVGANSTGINFTLNSEGANFGQGGDMTKPVVDMTGPPDRMMGVPGNDSTFKIFVGFSRPMSSVTVSMTVTSYPGGTAVSGTTAYYGTPPGGQGLPTHPNLAVFSLGSGVTLGMGKNIVVVVANTAADDSGNTIPGNTSDGSYVFSFTTNADTTTGGTYGQGNMIPPQVRGTTPGGGTFNNSRNTKIEIVFSEPMQVATIIPANIALYQLDSTGAETGSPIEMTTFSLDSTATSKILTMTPASLLGNTTSNTKYRIKVKGAVQSSAGVMLSPPEQMANWTFTQDFEVGTGTDLAAPTVLGTYPSNGASNTPVNQAAINVSFNKPMSSDTINTSNIYLKAGTSAVTGTLSYDPLSREAKFAPASALSANTYYTLTVGANVQALTGVAIATSTASFTTGSADNAAPQVTFANADDYSLSVTFSEPMSSASAADTSNYASSTLNSARYVVKQGAAGSTLDATHGTEVSVTNAQFTYDAPTMTVTIKGLSMTAGYDFYVAVTGVKDASGNQINPAANNTAKGTVQSSSFTQGMLGPGGGGTATGMAMGPSGMSSIDTMGMMPINVMPMTPVASKSSSYMVSFPITRALASGSQFVLTFPSGFTLANVATSSALEAPMNSDINGPGSNTVTLGAISGNDVAGTVTITTVNATNGAGTTDTADDRDFLNFQIKNITNTSVPREFGTAGYQVTIKTKNSSGQILETMTSMSFFISTPGTASISGRVLDDLGNGVNGITVFMGSPMTGPLSTTTATNAAGGGLDGEFTFTQLSVGDFFLGTPPTVTDGSGNEYAGKPFPEMIHVNSGQTITGKNITVSTSANLPPIKGKIFGAPVGEKIDVFAGGSNGFSAKSYRIVSGADNLQPINSETGADVGIAVNIYTVRAPATSTAAQNFFVGIGPWMPKGPQMMGPPPVPNFQPPAPYEINLTFSSPTSTITVLRTSSSTIATGSILQIGSIMSTANGLGFSVTAATNEIRGKVVDGSNNGIANADVYGYQPGGMGMGFHAMTDSTGNFTLKAVPGVYTIGANAPGMPPVAEQTVEVKAEGAVTGGTADGNTTADVVKDGVLITASNLFVFKLSKPSQVISGKVSDGTSGISNASVFAHQSNGPGWANAQTDSSGDYTLYVSAGTWIVEAQAPALGYLGSKTIIVTAGSNQTNQNFQVSSTLGTITGTVYKDNDSSGTYNAGDEAVTSAFVGLERTDASGGNGSSVNSSGVYSIRVPYGTYTVHAFAPGFGELPAQTGQTLSAGVQSITLNFALTAPKTITVKFWTGTAGSYSVYTVTKGFVDAQTANNHSGISVSNATSTTIYVPLGTYVMHGFIDGQPDPQLGFYADSVGTPGTPGTALPSNQIAATSNVTVHIVVASNMRTITGRVWKELSTPANTAYDAGTDTPLQYAWVWLATNDKTFGYGSQTDSNGQYTLKAPDGTYKFGCDKPGYLGPAPTDLTIGSDLSNQDFILTSSGDKKITGTVYAGSSALANAWVWAKRTGGGWAGSNSDANGYYELSVSAGDWNIEGAYEGYETIAANKQLITVTTANVSANINLTAISGYTQGLRMSEPITPANGGTVRSNTGRVFSAVVPPNALGTDTNSGSLSVSETSNLPKTDSMRVVGSKGVQISATNSSNQSLTNLNSSIEINLTYTAAELQAASVAFANINNLKLGYWDSTLSNWVTIPTVVTLNPTTATSYSNLTDVILKGTTDHLTTFAPVEAQGQGAPTTPSNAAAVVQSTSAIRVTWSAVSGATGYDVYRGTSSSGTFPRLGSEPSATSASYNDTGLTPGTTYYYKVSATNATGESAASAAVSATTQSVSGGGIIGGGGGAAIAQMGLSSPSPTVSPSPSPTPSAVTLIRYAGDPKVYVVENGQKRWIQTAEDFSKLGYQWKDVRIAPSSESYPTGVVKTPSVQAAVTLIRYAGDPKVYVIENSQKRWVKTGEDFSKLGYKWSDVRIAPASETYPDGAVKTAITPAPTAAVTLIRYANNPRVYVIENNQKRWVKTGEDFSKLGYKWNDVRLAPSTETYSDGTAKTAATVVAPTTLTKTLKKGSSGAEVNLLQEKLKTLGYFPSDVATTNYFGNVTQKAVKDFQQAKGLPQSGTADAKTRDLLNK